MLHKVSYRHARPFSFPAGMLYERTFAFEDGGVATVSGHIRFKSDD